MKLDEFYELVNGSLETILSRLLDEKRVYKFLKMFLADTCINDFNEAMNNDDINKAFLAVHTLKGMSINLDIICLYNICNEVTEMLRAKNLEEAKKHVDELNNEYHKVYNAIEQIEI